ncbi:unnamed protein product [Parascedosporium putredinis]|uniref:Rhodopsin domain-containing protein n=1 Tax=Parascedosporium putredinis TaxID=1442378 RepID=A0A9P1GZN7_9PEZI|nr:unnamed protein product [Parascedosporium putredinis]CAI7991950.1 unnamed protein product [Parascedosporium putredinis]
MGWIINATPEVEAQSNYKTILIVTLLLCILATCIGSLRIWVRARARETRYGLGLPVALRPAENLIIYTRVNFAGRPIYQLGISFFKLALLINYLRLFKGSHRQVYRKVVWGAIIDKSWNPFKEGTCLPPTPAFTGYAVVTILSDIAVALIPIPVLLELGISPAKKFGLIGIFVLGLFTTLCSILRCLQINRIQHGDGNSTMLVLWGVIEFNVGTYITAGSEINETSSNGSQDDILKSGNGPEPVPGNAILKSVSYSINSIKVNPQNPQGRPEGA